VPSTAFYTARSRVANLSKTRSADDPELTELRQQMREQFLVDSITRPRRGSGPTPTAGPPSA
jgi:hypothetical protein